MLEDKNHNEISKYLSGKMTQAEAHAFEKKALNDPFLYEAIEGTEQLDAQTFSKDVEGLKAQIEGRSKKSGLTIWKIAAMIALLIVGGFAVQYVLDDLHSPKLVQEMKREDSLKNGDTTKNKLDVARVDVPEEKVELEEIDSEAKPVTSAPIAQIEPDISKGGGAGFADHEDEYFETELPAADDLRDLEVLDEVANFDIVAEESAEGETDDEVKYVAEATSEPAEIKEEKESRKAKKEKSINHRNSFLRTNNDKLASRSKAAREAPNQISGTITDETGEGLPGVSVVIKGTTTGVTSDFDGVFQIAANEEDELVFSSTGMSTQQIEVGSKSILYVEMSPDISALQEVVVTGYAANDNEPTGYNGPSPVSDWKLFSEYLKKNLRYPNEAINNGTEGRVVLQLTVSRIGTITNIEVKKSLGDGCDEEAIRLVKEGPTWKPASRDGISIESKVKIRVKFKLEE